MWGGVFLEGGLVHFLLLGAVNTGTMDRGCIVHACAHLNLCMCVCSCVRSPGVRHAAEPDVGLPNTTQTQALALNGLGMQCLVILTEVFRGWGGLWRHSLLKLLGLLLARSSACPLSVYTKILGCHSFCRRVVCSHFLRRRHWFCVWQLIKSTRLIVCNIVVKKWVIVYFSSSWMTEWGDKHHMAVSS